MYSLQTLKSFACSRSPIFGFIRLLLGGIGSITLKSQIVEKNTHVKQTESSLHFNRSSVQFIVSSASARVSEVFFIEMKNFK